MEVKNFLLGFLFGLVIATESFAVRVEDGFSSHPYLMGYLMKESSAKGVLPQKTLAKSAMDMSEYVKFYFFSYKNQQEPEELFVGDSAALSNSMFNSSQKTYIVIHGYLNNVNSEAIQMIKNELVVAGESNVIAVDWSKIAVTIMYNVAAEETPNVGAYVSQLIRFLVSSGASLSQFHIIGHSLGAHVAGLTGYHLLPDKIPRITGLDPALPEFTDKGPDSRLDLSDALFVDCIHTCGGYLGMETPICSADFYPNLGSNPQPGCPYTDFIGVCSHMRSVEYFSESIKNLHYFNAKQCKNVPDKKLDDCTDSGALMGEPASPRFKGIFYVQTNKNYPYAMNIANVTA